jgi:large subunit ribosomal protein L18
MNNASKQLELQARRRARIRAKVSGTSERPRLAVFRSAKHVYAQLIDDASGKTLASVKDGELKKAEMKVEGMQAKTAAAYAVGQALAEKAKKAGITSVVFDRGGNAYHGRVKALADGARAGGLKF